MLRSANNARYSSAVPPILRLRWCDACSETSRQKRRDGSSRYLSSCSTASERSVDRVELMANPRRKQRRRRVCSIGTRSCFSRCARSSGTRSAPRRRSSYGISSRSAAKKVKPRTPPTNPPIQPILP